MKHEFVLKYTHHEFSICWCRTDWRSCPNYYDHLSWMNTICKSIKRNNALQQYQVEHYHVSTGSASVKAVTKWKYFWHIFRAFCKSIWICKSPNSLQKSKCLFIWYFNSQMVQNMYFKLILLFQAWRYNFFTWRSMQLRFTIICHCNTFFFLLIKVINADRVLNSADDDLRVIETRFIYIYVLNLFCKLSGSIKRSQLYS